MHFVKHLAIGIVATLLLVSCNVAFEHTDPGHTADLKAFEYLQHVLSPITDSKLPVIVVDIGLLPGGKDRPTPRDKLKELLVAIAQKQPRAIAVDIDFSPNEYGWILPDDPDFFDSCLELSAKRQMPIFLGVFRTRQEHPDTWLGLARYQSLAAAGLANSDDVRKLPRWIASDGDVPALPVIGQALAGALQTAEPKPPTWIRGVLEEAEKKRDGATFATIDTLANYSKLKQLRAEHMTFANAKSVADVGEALRGKLVLLGDVTAATDTFVVPGEARPVQGVYLMAVSAYSIAFEPLYEFTFAFRVALDIGISMTLVIGLWLISHRTSNMALRRKRRGWFLFIAIVICFAGGFALVRYAGILWLDFSATPLALFFHPAVESRVKNWVNRQIRKASHDKT
jgi:CHASE2 domain-containing sensor protein